VEPLSAGDPERIGDHSVHDGLGQDGGLAGNATFRTGRAVPLLWAGAYLAGALLCGSTSRLARQRSEHGAAGLFGLLFWFLLAVAAYRLWLGCRPARSVEVSAAGLVATNGSRRLVLPWAQLGRVRVVRRAQRDWLVAWPAGPGLPAPGFRTVHGGLRLFPVKHERGRRARDHEARDLHAALSWYGHGRVDPNA
jgi:eukaryotic-like serine/threonine-protein kinase